VPLIEDVTGEVEVDRQELLEALKQVLFAISTEETRYYMNGVLFHDVPNRLALVATNGHQLTRCQIPSPPFAAGYTCIVPSASIPAIVKLLAKGVAEDVQLRRSETLFEISTPGLVFVSKLVDGTFPDYERVIPERPANGATVEHADLVAAITRLEAVSEHGKKLATLVGLRFDPVEPALRLSLPNQPEAANEEIPASVTGTVSIETAAQLRHVVDLVGEFHGKSICIASDGTSSPILITDPASAATLIVQMPCRVASFQSQAA
jgi:DNA polymerase-3 subunit beta